MRARSLFAVSTTLIFAASALHATPSIAVADREQAAPSSLAFGPCPADIAQPFPALTCATLQVPLDYAQPTGAKVSLLLTKHTARNPAKRLGALLLNPGGPGGTGTTYAGSLTKPDATGFTRLEPAVLDAYDVIGLDPRGVGHSSAISCAVPTYFTPPQPDPDNLANRSALWKIWSGYADGCKAKAGGVLPHLGTTNVARDLETIRQALGEAKLNYVGYSYGTYLGAVYGQLYPGNVGRMILDGNVDPTPEDLWYQAGLAQSVAMQKRFDSYLAWVAKYDSTFHLGTTAAQVSAAWKKVLTEFRTTPHGQVGGNELLSLALGMMFSESNWIAFTQALSAYVVGGDDSDLVGFATPDLSAGSEQATAIFNAVMCADSKWPRDRSTYEADGSRIAKISQFAWFNIWNNGSACQNWPFDSPGRVKITGQGLPGLLLFNTIGDPATPYEGAVRMHKALPTSVLVTEKDSGKHGVFANPKLLLNSQANAIGTKYLVTGELPPLGTTVPGHAVPAPAAGKQAPGGLITTPSRPVE